MWLRRDTLEEFKAICRDEFDVELSDVEAHERAVAVLDLFSLLYLEESTPMDHPQINGDERDPGVQSNYGRQQEKHR